MQGQEVDKLINWPDFYRQYLPHMKPAGAHKMHDCCPFHHEDNPSFWFNTDNGMWKCEAGCGKGNATTFLAKIENISTEEAWARLCNMAGVDMADAGEKPSGKRVLRYCLDEYALEKRLPKEWLQGLGIVNGNKGDCIIIPYKNENGQKLATRIRRHPAADPRFLWGRGSKIDLYGLWRMSDIRVAKYCAVVEGESDTQTLWKLGIATLGVPGSSTINAKMCAHLLDIPLIYFHTEPDKAGRKMRAAFCAALLDIGYTGTVKSWSSAYHEGCKDPSGVFIKEGDGAASILWKLMKEGSVLDLELASRPDSESIPDAPIKLRMPNGFDIDERGIYQTDKNGIMEPDPFCWTPIMVTRLMPHKATCELKVELAYMRNRTWHTSRYPRLMLASGRTIIGLAEVGMDVNSENASTLVRYLSALERSNMDRIPEVKRISRYGWIDSQHFAPGACDDYYLDTEVTGKAAACVSSGDYTAWKDFMNKYRGRSVFRFIMAAAFSAPLIRILSQRIFLVYNWGDSQGGKTSCMFAALSVWGDPERMKVNFNTTSVGLERAANFYCDLPLGINERQVTDSKQSFLDAMVYMLSEGEGKLRGAKSGGLQEQLMWRTVVIASGEEPLISGTSKTGANNRTLEIFGQPFEAAAEASGMYRFLEKNYGHAGPEFIRRLIAADQVEIRQKFEEIRSVLSKRSKGKSESHISSVAVVVLADYLAEQWVWGSEAEDAMQMAIGMGDEILGGLQRLDEMDVNEKAYKFLIDWLVSNAEQFGDHFKTQRFGLFERDDPMQDGKKMPPHHALIIPSILDREMQKANFSYQKTVRWLAEKELIETRMRGGRLRYTLTRRIDGISTEVIRLTLPKDTLEGFTEVDDAELPF